MPPVLLTEEQLRKVVAGRPVGGDWPYRGGSEADVENHLRRAVDAIRSTGLLLVDADFDHYGSGYASYVHAFCEKTGGRSRRREGDVDVIEGLAVYLSRLTSFAVYGAEGRTRLPTGATSGFLSTDSIYSVPPGDWTAEVSAIRTALANAGFVLPPREHLAERLPFELEIPTLFDSEHVFDAIFYWSD